MAERLWQKKGQLETLITNKHRSNNKQTNSFLSFLITVVSQFCKNVLDIFVDILYMNTKYNTQLNINKYTHL